MIHLEQNGVLRHDYAYYAVLVLFSKHIVAFDSTLHTVAYNLILQYPQSIQWQNVKCCSILQHIVIYNSMF